MKIRNVHPLGWPAELAILPETIPHGETVDVPEDVAKILLKQAAWDPAETPKKKPATTPEES